MTLPAHIVLPPRKVHQSVSWWAVCTCGRYEVRLTEDETREAMQECRAAQAERLKEREVGPA
jgi:hypothetical protein